MSLLQPSMPNHLRSYKSRSTGYSGVKRCSSSPINSRESKTSIKSSSSKMDELSNVENMPNCLAGGGIISNSTSCSKATDCPRKRIDNHPSSVNSFQFSD